MTTMFRCEAIIGTIVAATSIHIDNTKTTVTAAVAAAAMAGGVQFPLGVAEI
jgi:hypothetical protein